jgi:hypothetical protein
MADVTSPPTAARPPISFGAWLGVVLLFLFFGIFVFVLVAATPHGNNYEQKRAEAREKKLNDARNAATQELNSYAWVDKGKGVARIPIDRAMQLTLRDLASKKPEPANPIATPAEAAAPAASPAGTGSFASSQLQARRRNQKQSKAPNLKIEINPPRQEIHLAQYREHNQARA